jgi:TetR/AcrR family transcriptional regulator, mexJK operon transcriptional repressor
MAALKDMLVTDRLAGIMRHRRPVITRHPHIMVLQPVITLHPDITLRPHIMVRHPVITHRDRAIMGMRAAGKRAKKTSGTKSQREARPRGGRPSREASALLADKILDVATELFLRDGYGAVSIVAIARVARISKRTFYHRFRDKGDLFTAVVHRIVERLRPENDKALFEGDDLEHILLRLARIILDAALTPNALALHRIIIAEATRFPELAMVVSQQGASHEAVRRIGALLEREARAGRISVDDYAFAAAQLLFMVVSLPQRRALVGPPMTSSERAAWVKGTVNLFLNGCRSRPHTDS